MMDKAQDTALPAVTPREAKPSGAAMWAAPQRVLRGALVGLGNRGMTLGLLARSFKGVEIAWIVDRSRDRIVQAEQILGGDLRQATELGEPLGDPDVDFVIVAVPDYLHRSIAEPAFQAGK